MEFGKKFFGGALTVTVFDEKVEGFVGCGRLGETLSALHGNFGLNFALSRRSVRWTVEYRFFGFFVRSTAMYAQMKLPGRGDGPRPMFWSDTDPNWFSDYLVDVLGGGFALYSVRPREFSPLFDYAFEADVPQFASRNELEMKLALAGRGR